MSDSIGRDLGERGRDEFGFERLRVWRFAVDFAGTVYRVTSDFPRTEVFGLTSQLRRAAVSVAANIAEGASRSSGRDQARFLEIAFGSLSETVTMFHIAHNQRLRLASSQRSAQSSLACSSFNAQRSTLNERMDQ